MDFAVVGMECVLPGAPDAERWIAGTAPALREVPAARWPDRALDHPTPGTPDRTVSRVGAWLDDADGLIPWTERVIGAALDQARARPARTHLFLANLALPSPAAVAGLRGEPARTTLAGDLQRLHAATPALHAHAFFGLAQATALDAACASGLYAVRLAMDALRTGACDAAIAAGVQACDPSYLLVGFSQLLALSPTGTPRPLDRRADGLVVGEGAAAVVLKRLPDALAAGDTVLAVLPGGGLGNDGRKGNMLAPDAAGQGRALRAAWGPGRDPRALGYVECHATGTLRGDATEIAALDALLAEAGGASQPVAVSSAKGLIGHTITVAGLAGLIRAIGAVRDGFVPAGPAEPIDAIVASTNLRAAPTREAWPSGVPRRAAVSAFGFGGTNAHLLVQAPPARPQVTARPTPPPPRQGRFGLRAGLRRLLDRDRGVEVPPAPRELPPPPQPAELVEVPRLAITGVGAQLGTWRDAALFAAIRAGRRLDSATGAAPIAEVHVDPRRWRLPPLELAELQPQQLLALEIGADAVERSGLLDRGLTRVACIVGMDLDPAVCEQVLRLEGSRERVGPLDAVRVQGQLPNFVANRLSAQLGLTGPSYTVSAAGASGLVALEQAARMLAAGEIDAAVIGAVDVSGKRQGAVAFVIEPLSGGREQALATIELGAPDLPASAAPADHGCATDLVGLLHAVLGDGRCGVGATAPGAPPAVAVTPSGNPIAELTPRDRVLAVPNPRGERRLGLFGAGAAAVRVEGEDPPHAPAPLPWRRWLLPPGAASATRAEDRRPLADAAAPASVAPAPPRSTVPAAPGVSPAATLRAPAEIARAPVPSPPVPAALREAIAGVDALTGALARSQAAATEAHAAFLRQRADAERALARLAYAFEADAPAALPDAAPPAAAPPAPPPPMAPAPTPTPPAFDHQQLLAHATGPLSACFGPDYADLDRYEPRTRMPAPPLLLCSRVVSIDGQRGELGPSRIVTEYDLPRDASWSHHDGKPNACVIVESGQADLFLVSYLGIEAHCRGERVYRLLDCDLTFHGPRPEVGETLRHDIRIHRFARLGETILFYFAYDCVSTTDGRPVLSMRNGCAGFFTPAELATPRGVDARPRPLDAPPAAIAPRLTTAVQRLDERGVAALVQGRFSDAFGPGFAPADGSRLTLPESEWRLVHRVEEVRVSGGPHGLGLARYEQVLRDDDWFNPCHFVGDPCMPGTLMFEGCLQAVQLWLLAAGVPADHPDGLFEPLPDVAMELRCRGQVVPGHSSLVYEARIREARLDGTPYAIADVLLSVDGTPVVLAKNVGVTIGRRADVTRSPRSGGSPASPPPRRPAPAVAAPPPAAEPTAATADAPAPVVDIRRVYEYSIGDAERAFGPRYADYAGRSPRCARMPGPPLLQMSRVLAADRPFEVVQGAAVSIAYDVPPDAWYFQLEPGNAMPFAILLETALQPCGWLTAWQAAGIKSGRDLYFRNLGGTATQHVEVWPDAGTLTTTTTQTMVAESAGLLVHGFELEVRAGDTLVYSCTTSFGYFSAAALDGQKGLPLRDEERRAALRARRLARPVPLAGHPAMPRDDWRNLDEVCVADPTGGAHGLGFYEGRKRVDPDEWFFTAHFFLDPVMPGSLGLEAALQLARYVWHERNGPAPRLRPIRVGVPHTWKYRGQVRRPVGAMTVELEVKALSATELVFDAIVRADGMPIYQLEDFGVEVGAPAPAPALPARPAPPAFSALLDHFEPDGEGGGIGRVLLDPARFPWLDDHRPTVTAPALPLAFAAELAAEAAQALAPELAVVGLPLVEADKWIHTADGPTEVLVVATRAGDQVAVSLAVHVDNPRFPKLSGPKVHMRAIVQLGDRYLPAPAVSAAVDAPPVGLDAATYYSSGLTFHGPALQGVIDPGVRGPEAALATLASGDDARVNGAGVHRFLLDPFLLDNATHPMWSGEPEVWSPQIPAGRLAYPVRAEGLALYGPRPTGPVRCRLDRVAADAQRLVFDVVLIGSAGSWCSFRWTEALVPGGPVLGQRTPVRHRFVWERQPDARVRVGRRVGDRARVERADLIEPIEGTLVGLYCTAREVDAWRAAPDREAWALARLAAKEAVRDWLRGRLRDVHPQTVELLDLRPDWFVPVNCTSLDAQAWIDHLGPTRYAIRVEATDGAAEAWVEAVV